ncbi:hypothetical protein HOY82DRAFT_568586 [Tuber indicum]|nr:hypothetical protein HOY82DRAFT_568586 [Tuber indicum]
MINLSNPPDPPSPIVIATLSLGRQWGIVGFRITSRESPVRVQYHFYILDSAL